MNYELLDEDDHSYHLQDPKGKQIKIAKQAISDALHEKIRGYAKGGKVESPFEDLSAGSDPLMSPLEEPQSESIPDYTSAAQPYSRLDSIMTNLPESPRLEAGKERSNIPSWNRSSQQDEVSESSPGMENLIASNGSIPRDSVQPNQNISVNQVPIGGESAGQSGLPSIAAPGDVSRVQGAPGMDPYGQMMSANKLQSQAQQNYYSEAKKAQDEANTRNIEIDNTHAQISSGLNKQQDALMQAMMSQKIEPNRLWSNAGTGSKISAAIGMILGGIGAGLTGGPNQALQVINRLVDQDIDAQKSELGKKQTLYSMNLQKYRDEQTAYAATKAQLSAVTQGKLSSAAAVLGTQQAKATELQANAQIGVYRQQLNQQIAQQQTVRAVMGHLQNTGDMSYADYLPDKQREEALSRAVPGYGLANTKEAAAKANELVSTTKAGTELINQLKTFSGKPLSKVSPADKRQAETLSRMIIGQIREGVLGPGTVNDSERKILEGIVSNPTNVFQLSSTAKRSLETIVDSLETKQRIGLTQYGIKNVPKKLDKGAPIR